MDTTFSFLCPSALQNSASLMKRDWGDLQWISYITAHSILSHQTPRQWDPTGPTVRAKPQAGSLGLLVSLLHISGSPIGWRGTAQLLFLADRLEGLTCSYLCCTSMWRSGCCMGLCLTEVQADDSVGLSLPTEAVTPSQKATRTRSYINKSNQKRLEK